MHSSIARLLPLLLVSLLLTACDSGGDSDPTVDGTWTGTTVVGGSSIQMDLNLVENNRVINGTGTLNIGGSFAVTITGTHNYPNVTMSITDGIDTLVYTATMAGDDKTLTGNLTGGGLTGSISITLRK
jgi:hypothetical protein